MKIKVKDRVKIITGKYKGKEATVEKVFPSKHKVVVTGVNVVKRNSKPSRQNKGGIIELTKPIDISNVMLICPKNNKPTRVKYQIVDGKKIRVSKISGEAI